MAKNYFHTSDPLSASIDLEWSAELEFVWRKILTQNLSIMLIEPVSGEPICLRANMKEKKSTTTFDPNMFTDPHVKKIEGFIRYSETLKDVYEYYETDWKFHFFALCTAPKYRQQGIAKTMMSFALDVTRNLGIYPVYIKGEGTSNYSKKIYEKLNFSVILDVPFVDYKNNGEIVFANTGEHKTMTVFGYALRNKDD